MTPELTALALAGLLQTLQFGLFALLANMELGARYTMGPRDAAPEHPLSTLAGRLQRAMNNHFEGLILFTMAVTVVTLGQQSTPLTQACGWTYLAARTAYIPAYALGLSPWRSLIWSAGFFATLTMLVAALI